jgi:hypothetical protein
MRAEGISTFCCDIAYSRSPAAWRASASVTNTCHQTDFPRRHRMTCQSGILERRVGIRAVAASAIGHERLVSKVAHFDHLGDEVGKSVEQVLPPAADSGVAVLAALDSGQERDGLHVSVHQFEKGIEVTSVDGVNGSVM